MGSPSVFWLGSCCSTFLVFCVVLYVFVLCLVYPMLLVSLDCPFLVAHSVFLNVYILLKVVLNTDSYNFKLTPYVIVAYTCLYYNLQKVKTKNVSIYFPN